MLDALKSTLLHALELAVSIAAAVIVMRLFNLGNDQVAMLAGLVLDIVSKFIRSSGNDWVNA